MKAQTEKGATYSSADLAERAICRRAVEAVIWTDPFERADITSNTYWDWYVNKGYMVMAAQGLVEGFLKTFKEFPPRQKAASFTIDHAMEKMEAAWAGGSAAVTKTA